MSTGKKLAQTAQMLAERPFHRRPTVQPASHRPAVSQMEFGTGRADVMRSVCLLLLYSGGIFHPVQSAGVPQL